MQSRSFEDWKKLVDAELEKRCGMSSEDLPDVDYRGMYAVGDTPAVAARQAIANAKDEEW